MKVKVIKKFMDKHTKKVYKVGEILNVDEKRYEEILTVGKLVEKVEEKKSTKNKAEQTAE